VIKSGRDVHEKMVLRRVAHEKVYDAMQAFYNDKDAIVFGCAGLSGLLDKPLENDSMGLFLFGEVCTVDGIAEFGNLMLSKLVIK
jgi:Asp/Glu/hydantoin racemase